VIKKITTFAVTAFILFVSSGGVKAGTYYFSETSYNYTHSYYYAGPYRYGYAQSQYQIKFYRPYDDQAYNALVPKDNTLNVKVSVTQSGYNVLYGQIPNAISRINEVDTRLADVKAKLTELEHVQDLTQEKIDSMYQRQHEMGQEYENLYQTGYNTARFDAWDQMIQEAVQEVSGVSVDQLVDFAVQSMSYSKFRPSQLGVARLDQKENELTMNRLFKSLISAQAGPRDATVHWKNFNECQRLGKSYGYWTETGHFVIVTTPEAPACQTGYCSCESVL